MRLTAILLLAACLCAHAGAWSQTVSFTGKDVPLEQVFASLKKQTGFGFFYKSEVLHGTHNVTLDLKNVSLEAFLDICLRHEPLTYKVVGQTVFISRREDHAAITETLGPGGPDRDIKGRITSPNGEPLANANIIIKRTGHGTVTNSNGEFTLRAVGPQDIVTVSYIGYKTQSVSLKNRSSLTIVLDPATDELDKMVVQAYGQTSQRLATGSIVTVRAEDIAKQPVMNPLEALQGKVAGLLVTKTNGYASAPIKLEIRGRNNINGDFPSDPLYIIDGIPLTILEISNTGNYDQGSPGFIQNGFNGPSGNGQSPFFNVNPADIESIEVLKDADATAIYGSRGANGVILITTKKGKAGKTRLESNFYQGNGYVTNYWKMLNLKQYLQMRREALKNDGVIPDMNNAPDLVSWDTTRYTDWQKYLWGNAAKSTDFQVSLAGGDSRTNFRMGGGYHRETSVLTVHGADQLISVSTNISHRGLNQKFAVGLTANYSYTQSDQISVPAAVTLPPDTPPAYDSLGNLNFAGWSPNQDLYPFAALLQPYSTKTSLLTSSLNLKYEIIKGLYIKATLGYNTAQANQTNEIPIVSQNPLLNPKGSSNFGYNTNRSWITEPQIEYSGLINKGKLNVLVGASSQDTKSEGLYVAGSGYTSDALLHTISNAVTVTATDRFGKYRYAAIFSRVNYNWENKIILNLNARRDGSSRFGPGKQFGNFGSAGAAWIFSEESFIKRKFKGLSFGKLRASYGVAGSDQAAGEYAYLSRWSSQSIPPYNGVAGLVPIQHVDSIFHWQSNHKSEIALNLGFLNDRLLLEFAIYRNRCDNQLIRFPLPLFTGFPIVVANSPANVQNMGYECQVTGKIIEHKIFHWTVDFNIGVNRNKLLSYPNLAQSPYADFYVVGQSLNIIKLLHFIGVNPLTGQYAFLDKNHDGNISKNPGPGDDRFNIDLSPKYFGGLTTMFKYKNWEFSAFFYFIKQVGFNALNTSGFPGQMSNQPIEVLKRWQKPGDITNVARFTSGNGISDLTYDNDFHSLSDGAYTDASFIRLRNVSINYELPSEIAHKMQLQGLSIFLRGENLLLITNYKGLDPETQNFGSMPPKKVFTTGLSLHF